MDGWVVVDRCLCDGGTAVGWVCVVGSGVIGWGPVGLLGVWCSGRGPADHGADAGADWLRLVLFRFGFFWFWIQSEPVGGRQQWPNPRPHKRKNFSQSSDVHDVLINS